jgi:putative transposase
LFEKPEDYNAFEGVMEEAFEREPLPIFAYCVMPNHWHFVVRPQTDHQVSDFFRWMTHTHTMRWHAHHGTGGTGHLYQGRFKTFPIEQDEHLLTVLRYVERNPLRAGLTSSAEAWKWSSAWRSCSGNTESRALLASWPVPRPRRWLALVNEHQTESEVAAIRQSVTRGTPFGSNRWVSQAASRLQLKHTLRPRGRPKTKK